MNQASREMGIFRRTPRRGPAVQDSLTGQAAAGHPAKDVAAGQVSFADVVADRGSLKAQQQANAAAGPPAGPEENGVRVLAAAVACMHSAGGAAAWCALPCTACQTSGVRCPAVQHEQCK